MNHAPTSAPGGAPRVRHRILWHVVAGLGLMHVGAILAFFPQFFSWSALAAAVILYWVTGGLGITLCYHRLLTHRSFKTPKWLEYFLTTCGCLAWQGGPIQWVGDHRLHHKHSDTDLDPHTPNHGFTWAHVFWCMIEDPSERPARDVAKDLQRDPGLALLDKWFWVPQFVMAIVLFGLGEFAARGLGWATSGLSWVVWGVFVRTVAVFHITWFVNSASHTWGYRNFDTEDRSTNLWWVALLGFGEGWHNNHHAHQRSAAHGMRWFEFDLTYLTIRILKRLGLAWDVVDAKPLEGTLKARNRVPAQLPADSAPSVPALTARPAEGV